MRPYLLRLISREKKTNKLSNKKKMKLPNIISDKMRQNLDYQQETERVGLTF